MQPPIPQRAGPFLYLRGHDARGLHLCVLAVRPEAEAAPELHAGAAPVRTAPILRCAGLCVWRAEFTLSPDAGGYAFEGRHHPVATDLSGDLRIAFVSCNGQEHHDLSRSPESRNRLWLRLAEQHRAQPFHLLLQGGDQVYADEVLEADPRLAAWRAGEARGRAPLDAAERERLAAALDRAFLHRYLATLALPGSAEAMASIPSFAMWDDHDICDGWGSLSPAQLDADVGRLLFERARAWFLVFQTGSAPDALPDHALDPGGATLAGAVHLPGLDILAPDLRSERRPDRVMGPAGWAAFERGLARARAPRLLLMSSVPALGPRLSLIESVLHLLPRAQKYEDDLRDQWQSRAHRHEWRRFLERLTAHHEAGRATTLLSGEIHLATRGTIAARPAPLHQLVASGITHPPAPRGWALALGALARLGESPLRDRPTRFHPLPGQRGIYRAERNYLVLERRGTGWQARWEMEETGTTPPLPL